MLSGQWKWIQNVVWYPATVAGDTIFIRILLKFVAKDQSTGSGNGFTTNSQVITWTDDG